MTRTHSPVSSTRRTFVKGCFATAAGAALADRPLWAFEPAGDTLVVVFLRGGMDGLSLVPPISGPDRSLYETARPTLRVPLAGDGAALTLGGGFGLHPAAAPLMPLFDTGKLAVVQATGMHDPTRSHFEAQDYIELGTPGVKTIGSGWLHRHLATADNLPTEILVPSLAAGTMQPLSLLGSRDTLTLDDPEFFTFSTGPWRWIDEQRVVMEQVYGVETSIVNATGLQTMNAVDIVATNVTGDYTPAGGAVYGGDEAGGRFRLAAQMLSLDLGIRVVTIDLGGWDTHENQGNTGGIFDGLAGSLCAGLAALMTDMQARGISDRLTVVVMTEFGRRLAENGDEGTDHGHAGPMLVIGDHVVGGLHGVFPGLDRDRLFEGVDLEVTTDYRQVLTEILIKRLGNDRIEDVFPGYTGYQPLGIVRGEVDPVRSGGSRVTP